MRPIKSPLCHRCSATDPQKFWGRQKNTCYECYKVLKAEKYAVDKSSEPHLCLDCGEDSPEMFYGNSKTRCKECTYKRVRPNAWNSGVCLCKECGEDDLELFNVELNRSMCKVCFVRKRIKATFPIWGDLVELQGGETCAICKRPPSQSQDNHLWINYDPKTLKIRGLLCRECDLRVNFAPNFHADKERSFIKDPPIRNGSLFSGPRGHGKFSKI
jgi:hypothetical protein